MSRQSLPPREQQTFLPGRSLVFSMRLVGLALLGLSLASSALGQTRGSIAIRRAAGPIRIDGELDDPGWQGAAEIREFFEISPGDNLPPKAKTTAWITYDDRFFYVAVRSDDPHPEAIRAHYTERDHFASDQDFVGIMLDTRNQGRTALELFVNPLGIQDDFALDEATANGSNEDPSPDFYWDSAAKLTPAGW